MGPRIKLFAHLRTIRPRLNGFIIQHTVDNALFLVGNRNVSDMRLAFELGVIHNQLNLGQDEVGTSDEAMPHLRAIEDAMEAIKIWLREVA